jgi:hypothetical protein
MNRMRLCLGGEAPAAFLVQVSMCDLWMNAEMVGFSYAEVVKEFPGLLAYTQATQQGFRAFGGPADGGVFRYALRKAIECLLSRTGFL